MSKEDKEIEKLVDELIEGNKISKEQRQVFILLFRGEYFKGREDGIQDIKKQVDRFSIITKSLVKSVEELIDEENVLVKKDIESELKDLCYMVEAQFNRFNMWMKSKEVRLWEKHYQKKNLFIMLKNMKNIIVTTNMIFILAK